MTKIMNAWVFVMQLVFVNDMGILSCLEGCIYHREKQKIFKECLNLLIYIV